MIPVLFVGPLVQLLALGYAANLDVQRHPDRARGPGPQRRQPRARRALHGLGLLRRRGRRGRRPSASSPGCVDGPGPARARHRRRLRRRRCRRADAARAGDRRRHATRTPPWSASATPRASSTRPARRSRAPRCRAAAGQAAAAARARPARIELVPRVWYNPDLKSRWFYVPAVLAMVLHARDHDPALDGGGAREGDRHAGADHRHAAPALAAHRSAS